MNELLLMINGESYTLITDYKDNEIYRQGLNKLVRNIYGFDFEDWYQAGYWKDRYIPYSLLHKDELVANISVNTLDYLVDGERKAYLQLGTVMTDESYRGKGLSRALMEHILKEYEGLELIYLYANDSVLDFYPKFGFMEAKEYVHTRLAYKSGNPYSYRKLDMNSGEDTKLLFKLVTDTLPVSRVSMMDNPGLPMFYLTKFMRENIYYFEELQLVAVAELEAGNLYLTDIFTTKEFDLEGIISSLMDREEMKVILGFTPRDAKGYDIEPLSVEGSTFFVKGRAVGNGNPLGYGRFPELSHA